MYKSLLFAGMLSLVSLSSIAQHTDEILVENSNGLVDEINHPAANIQYNPSAILLKHVALPNKQHYKYTRFKTADGQYLLRASENGKEVFTTEYKRTNLHGVWKSKYSTGQLADSGTFKNNQPDGEWRYWYANGQLRSVRHYNAEKWQVVQNEIRRHNYKISTNNQLAQMAQKKDGSFDAATGSKHQFAGWNTYHAPYKHGLQHGLFMEYFESGAVKDSGYYKDGLRDGLWVSFYENGQVASQGGYVKGQRVSGWKYFDNQGRLTSLVEYKEGRLVHKKDYNPVTGR